MNFSAPPRRIIDGKKPSASAPSTWSKTTLQQRATSSNESVKSFDEEYPVLGTSASKACAGAGTGNSTRTGSYAKMAATWAKEEEERKIAEANEMRERIERERREEYELAERRRIFNSIHAHRQQQEYTTTHDYTEEYVNEEFDEDEYTQTNVRTERRSTAARYEECDDEECDEEYD